MMEWSEARNILCIRLDAMGDVLMTTPAMKSLKEALPGRKLTLLTSSEGARIAKSIPLFDEIISYKAPWLKATGQKDNAEDDFKMMNMLKEKKFDAAVIFTVYSQNPLPSALFCFLTGIPLRAGYCRENPYSLLTHWVREDEPQLHIRHEVKRHLDLVKNLGAKGENGPLILQADCQSELSVVEKLKKRGISAHDKNWVVIHPGATAESRRYQLEGFAHAADLLRKKTGLHVLFTGSPDEAALVEGIQRKMSETSENLAGELNLEEMIALVKISPLLISNNSGPVHMAAALGTPTVVLYALTNPQHTPWFITHRILYHDVGCRFCYKSICPQGNNACLNNIGPEAIVEKALELFDKGIDSSYDFNAVHPLVSEPLNF